jgi:hypothetical protein
MKIINDSSNKNGVINKKIRKQTKSKQKKIKLDTTKYKFINSNINGVNALIIPYVRTSTNTLEQNTSLIEQTNVIKNKFDNLKNIIIETVSISNNLSSKLIDIVLKNKNEKIAIVSKSIDRIIRNNKDMDFLCNNVKFICTCHPELVFYDLENTSDVDKIKSMLVNFENEITNLKSRISKSKSPSSITNDEKKLRLDRKLNTIKKLFFTINNKISVDIVNKIWNEYIEILQTYKSLESYKDIYKKYESYLSINKDHYIYKSRFNTKMLKVIEKKNIVYDIIKLIFDNNQIGYDEIILNEPYNIIYRKIKL